tara:strand:- start:614 stop:787 length:174 start_codon:yes stop_codon:yes gene_type:complete
MNKSVIFYLILGALIIFQLVNNGRINFNLDPPENRSTEQRQNELEKIDEILKQHNIE